MYKYKNKYLMYNVKSQLILKKWLTKNQKILLIQYIEFYQTKFSIIYIKNRLNSFKYYYLFDLFLNNLSFQIFSIQQLIIRNKNNYKTLIQKLKNKIQLLFNFKCFKDKPYILSHSMNNILNRAIQQLFILLLNPIVEINLPQNSHLKNNINQIIIPNYMQKIVSTSILRKNKLFKFYFVWKVFIKKCFEFINLNCILKFISIPYIYKSTIKNRLQLKPIKFKYNIFNNCCVHNFNNEFIYFLFLNFFFCELKFLVTQIIFCLKKIAFNNFTNNLYYKNNNLWFNNYWNNVANKNSIFNLKFFECIQNNFISMSSFYYF
jgi:hypothetical protein